MDRQDKPVSSSISNEELVDKSKNFVEVFFESDMSLFKDNDNANADNNWNFLDDDDDDDEPEPAPTITEDDIEQLRKKYTARGMAGLKNFGCTCYMNSILQCLSHTPLFSAFVREQYFEPVLYNNRLELLKSVKRRKLNLPNEEDPDVSEAQVEAARKKTVTYTLSETLIEMWRCNRIVVPRSFKDVIGAYNSMFKVDWEQHDSQELLEFVLNRMSEETRKEIIKVRFNEMSDSVKKLIETAKNFKNIVDDANISDEEKYKISIEYKQYKKEHMNDVITLDAFLFWEKFYKQNYSIITTLFTGLFLSTVKCLECNNLVTVFEPFKTLSISVPVHGEATLEECLKQFSVEEMLTGDNMYKCEKCAKQVNAVKKMYIWEAPEILIIHLKRFTNSLQKVGSTINFPMTNLRLTDNYSPIRPNENVSYDLYALNEHIGMTLGSGHYISHVKNVLNGRWYECNDSSVFHVPEDTIDKEIRTKNAYLLFYERKRN